MTPSYCVIRALNRNPFGYIGYICKAKRKPRKDIPKKTIGLDRYKYSKRSVVQIGQGNPNQKVLVHALSDE